MAEKQPPATSPPGDDATQPLSQDDTGTRVTPPAATWEPPGATTPPPGGPPPPPPGAAPSGPPPGAASGPPPGAPPPGPPSGRSRGGIPLPAFIAVAVVAVAALVFGIFMFLGKNSEADKKEEAQEEAEEAQEEAQQTRRELRLAIEEIEAANEEIAELEDTLDAIGGELTETEDFAAALDQVLGTGAVAADSLYDCAVTAYEFILNFLETGTPDTGQAEAVDDRCFAAEDDYNAFIDALSGLQ